jgi:hypothetical protein
MKTTPRSPLQSAALRTRAAFTSAAALVLASCALALTASVNAATILAAPEEAGLRAAIDAAQAGDTVVLSGSLELQAPVRITKALTIRSDRKDPWYVWIRGSFDGALFHVEADGITFEDLRLLGSPQTDGLLVEADVVLRNCLINNFRDPVVVDFWTRPHPRVRLERVTVDGNARGLICPILEAKDSTFRLNRSVGAGPWIGYLEGCLFESNLGDGLGLTFGTVTNCVFRYNTDLGLRFDPDGPNLLNLSGSLFYGNVGGGLLLREEAVATIDNCTFTRHTGLPAIEINEVFDVLFRHCTVVDNLVVGEGDPWTPPYHPAGAAFWIHRAGRVELQNCLIADNPTTESPHASGLVGDWTDGGGNVIGGPARLSQLRDNSGPTLSLLPLPDSPAIDAGLPSDLMLDARGLSRLAGARPDAGAVESSASELMDTDGDGLPDIWELLYGLDPNDPTDALSDRDGDDHDALTEFKHRSNPNDPQSVLRLGRSPLFPPSFLTWRAFPGVMYQVETSTDLREWSPVSDPGSLAGWANGYRIFALGIQTDLPIAFYRLSVAGNPFDKSSDWAAPAEDQP